jgi:hypothetical protein
MLGLLTLFSKGLVANLGELHPDSNLIYRTQTAPQLIGPSLLCNVSGTVVGSFSGSGDPITDLYGWRIFSPSGDLLFTRTPGAFQIIDYTFITNGIHRVELDVSRGGIELAKFSKLVEVVQEPIKLLLGEYVSCSSQPIEIQAIDPSSSKFSSYKFEWKNETGTVVSTSNTLITSEEGDFTVQYFIENSSGERTCDFLFTTNISTISSIVIERSDADVCVDGEISFQTNPQLFGEWFVQKIGEPSIKSFGIRSSLTIRPGSDLVDFGQYEVSFVLENPSNPTCSPEGKINFRYNPEPIFVFESAETSSGCLQSDGKLIIKALTDLDFINIEGTGISYGPFVAGELIEIPNLNSGTYNLIGGLGPCLNSIGSVVPLANPPTALEFEIDDIIGEACTTNGKIPGSFQVTMLNGPNANAFYRVINEKGGEAMNQPLPNATVFRVNIPGGKYFFEIYDEDDECILPSRDELIIPGKDQTNFQIPETLNICQSFELTPVTSQSLIFTITRPDLTIDTKNAGEPILLNQKGEYKIIGTLPGQVDVCPTEKIILIDLIDPVDFEVIQVSEDCIVGNRSYEANIFSRDPTTVLFFWRNEIDEIIGTSQRLDLPPTSFGNYSLEVQPANSEACPIPPKEFLAKEPVLSVDVTLVATKLCEFGPKAILDLSTTFPEEVTDVEWRRYDEAGNIEVLSQFDNQYQIEVDIEGTYEAAIFSRVPALNKDCELGRSNVQLDLNPNKVDFNIPSNLSICEVYSFTPQSTQPLFFEVTRPDASTVDLSPGESIELNQSGIYSFLGFDPTISGPLCPELKFLDVIVNQKISFSPNFFEETCQGTKTYKAEIGTVDPATAEFSWFDSSGNIIGTDQFLTLTTFGQFSLDVQPLGSLSCDQIPVSFEVDPPLLSQAVSLIADPFCPDAEFAQIVVESDFQNIAQIQWWLTDLNGVQSQLTAELNKKSISARSEGTYEVRILNSIGCQLGFDRVLLMRSMDAVRPIVKESYKVCPLYEIGPTINPGNFIAYEWYFEDQLVSTNPVYKPIQPGSYNLVVESAEGCNYSIGFITEEECELRVSYPNAIKPGNPEKEFLIYTNFLVDKLKVSIFNRWGELIYFCEKTDLISSESTCPWNGTYRGETIPNGTYSIRIDLENFEKKITKVQNGFILVIE